MRLKLSLRPEKTIPRDFVIHFFTNLRVPCKGHLFVFMLSFVATTLSSPLNISLISGWILTSSASYIYLRHGEMLVTFLESHFPTKFGVHL